jgi:hypothetical protein
LTFFKIKGVGTLSSHKGKGKGKFKRLIGHEGQKEKKRYSSTLSLTSAIDVG